MHKVHRIKLQKEFINAVYNVEKTFEIRYNDRNYQVHDVIEFIPMDGTKEIYHPIAENKYWISYVLEYEGLKDGYVAFQITPLNDDWWDLFKGLYDTSTILNYPTCENYDCAYNIESKCYNISVIKDNVPDGICTCEQSQHNNTAV